MIVDPFLTSDSHIQVWYKHRWKWVFKWRL